jgi:FAD/FMN-containing dehydrogenase
MTDITSWGRFPRVVAQELFPQTIEEAQEIISTHSVVTPRGLARSYGDSALGEFCLNTRYLDKFLEFDSKTGILVCEAGVSLDEILRVFVPQGWFLPVTPGTRFVSIGGAIASDIHGKNHHVAGTFGEHVLWIELIDDTGSIVRCSKEDKLDLFLATCGGMGLTGTIVRASFALKPIFSAYIDEITYKCENLSEVLDKFELHNASTYSVAWIDCLARGKHLGRSLLMVGEHSAHGELTVHPNKPLIKAPFDLPAWILNSFTMKIFNSIYFHKALTKKHEKLVHYGPFFYPLDAVKDWNRFYGKPGFVQYQFVIPLQSGRDALRTILEKIAESGKGSTLAVLKVFGKENDNYISFPIEGYTLALDFKVEDSLFSLLDELDDLVLSYGGRLYLTKDSRMSEKHFKASYSRWKKFESVVSKYSTTRKMTSRQAQRIGIA